VVIYFFFLIVITGLLTSFTDVTQKRVKNKHLLIISFIALFSYLIFFNLGQLNLSFQFILNPIVSLIVGFLLYLAGLWKPGDAKLFITYSLLLNSNEYSTIFPLSCFALFANTFLISFLFMIPFFVMSIIDNKSKIIKEVITGKIFTKFAKTFLITFCLSWAIRPILNSSPLKDNNFLNFIILYIGYLSIYNFIHKIKYKLLIIFVFLLGFMLRYVFMPGSFSFISIIDYLKHILKFSLIFYILKIIITSYDKKPQRIAFAPFMFLGSILCYTDFLSWAINIITSFRR